MLQAAGDDLAACKVFYGKGKSIMEKNRKLLLQQLKENRKYIVVLMMMSFVISIFSLTVPWFMQYFTDNIIVTGAWEKAYLVCCVGISGGKGCFHGRNSQVRISLLCTKERYITSR